jgi:hypothetical protein
MRRACSVEDRRIKATGKTQLSALPGIDNKTEHAEQLDSEKSPVE